MAKTYYLIALPDKGIGLEVLGAALCRWLTHLPRQMALLLSLHPRFEFWNGGTTL
jgi:hypothetical protein